MTSRHRLVVLAAGASCAAATTALVFASTPSASAPPIGRPKSSGVRANIVGASPWTPLTNPPPFGTPGTMLLESDGTVLVHNEPDNNTTGGTTDWWKLTPASNGSYIDG